MDAEPNTVVLAASSLTTASSSQAPAASALRTHSAPPSSSALSPPSTNPSPSTQARSFTVRFADCDRLSAPGARPSTTLSPASAAPSSVASTSVTLTSPISSITTSALSSSPSSSPGNSSSSEASPSPSPQHFSPSSSAFVSASGSPFISPDPSLQREESNGSFDHATGNGAPPANTACELELAPTFDSSRDAKQPKYSQASVSSSPVTNFVRAVQSDAALELVPTISLVSSAGSSAPPARPQPAPRISPSPSSSARPRSCDVFIGMHGQSSSLSRFAKWLRAELELQGIACFSADRTRYSDSRSHDIARRIINSCTFGVVIITKRAFRNLYSIEELKIFLERKNLVPVFFDLAPSDCLARDIVERRGEVWEKEGGEVWRLFGGEEREWREAVDGLSRVEEWKLEAYNGNWRNCILKAVSLLGTRLGRRSVAERERVRKERVEGEEYPFPRNTRFVGREKELRALEGLLFVKEEAEDDWDEEKDRLRELTRPHFRRKSDVDRWPRSSRQLGRESHVTRRKSDADRWQRRPAEAGLDGGVARRKSDSDRWRGVLVEGEGHRFTDAIWTGGASSPPLSESQRGKDVVWEVVEDTRWEIELHRGRSMQRFRDGHRNRNMQRERQLTRHRQAHTAREIWGVESGPLSFREGGIACISGASGIGKTELVLEFAYRFSQRYRMVLWVSGEARYFRQNYLNLSLFLGLDVGTESQVGPERGRIRTFDEQEEEAFQRVKRELQRDVPYLLIIDNLESERDWWDGREASELLPRAGGATHVIITTRLSKVMNLQSLELSYLSGVEALSLMRGKREFSSQELDALKEIEEKLGRLTFGLGIVGTLLSELPIVPSDLLEKIDKGFLKDWTWGSREEATLKNNPFLVKLLGVCLSYLDQADGPVDLAMRMAWVGGWFAPFPIPISLLALAASKFPERSRGLKLWRRFSSAFCCFVASQTKRWETEAGALLVRFGIAKRCSRQGWVNFHEIVQLYARKRGGVLAAKAMVQGVRKRGAISLHSEHFWAACFLVLGFGNDPATVELKVVDLISFIKRGVLQLALRAFTTFSRCHAALELLRLCSNMLEDVEKSFVSQIHDWWDKSLCWKRSGYAGHQVDEYVWQEVTLLKALLLETRAKLMLKGGQFDAGEEICRTCISIRTVMLGQDHPDTLSAQETLAKLVRYRSSI